MKVEVIEPSELSRDLIEQWRGLQLAGSGLASPFLSPEYVRAVGEVRHDVRVAVMELEGRIIGFFPFQKGRWNVAHSIAPSICDLSGIIVADGVAWNPRSIVKQCGVAGWTFSNVPAASCLSPYQRILKQASVISLRAGFDGYKRELKADGSQVIYDVERKMRKLEREAGPVRFERNTNDETVFETLVRWKSDQRRRTNAVDVLQSKWLIDLLRRLRAIDTPEFACEVSALYSGDNLAAVHLGIRSSTVLHYWFPAYNRRLSGYSPGSILLFEMAKEAALNGIERIDLGPGDEPYKERFANGAIELASGSVDCTAARRMLMHAWFGARAHYTRSRIRPLIRSAKRLAVRAYYFAADFAG